MKIWEKFVVLEGLDGAGTTTQLDKLCEYAQRNNIPYFRTFEPSDGFIGKIVRDILEKRQSADPLTLAQLFVADRREHVKLMKEALERGEWVFCDRYLFSSLAYQSLGLDFNTVEELNKEFPLPGICLYVECSVETTLKRRGSRESEDLFETEELQRQVYSNYEKAFTLYSKKNKDFLKRIDGEKSVHEVFQEILKTLNLL